MSVHSRSRAVLRGESASVSEDVSVEEMSRLSVRGGMVVGGVFSSSVQSHSVLGDHCSDRTSLSRLELKDGSSVKIGSSLRRGTELSAELLTGSELRMPCSAKESQLHLELSEDSDYHVHRSWVASERPINLAVPPSESSVVKYLTPKSSVDNFNSNKTSALERKTKALGWQSINAATGAADLTPVPDIMLIGDQASGVAVSAAAVSGDVAGKDGDVAGKDGDVAGGSAKKGAAPAKGPGGGAKPENKTQGRFAGTDDDASKEGGKDGGTEGAKEGGRDGGRDRNRESERNRELKRDGRGSGERGSAELDTPLTGKHRQERNQDRSQERGSQEPTTAEPPVPAGGSSDPEQYSLTARSLLNEHDHNGTRRSRFLRDPAPRRSAKESKRRKREGEA
ncbi:hypothetical protein GNI_001540 [Gregarina niphandrodes]|uniref:Uncharacterized protein n=1 Tax=Gregarina niphandrodes TaxID=110365 RepID=A0A023BE34_GRENI|nr:hypothetical protein GNI_001540 [Gregarina niphandrodes]EZG89640.1 hypothetical protein GNI_001540 [Gregarina niphandrodes]|eukprot:XP_011128474.1 hypothetical protein GNI_001540 [Gregarina niphandrodes]